MAPGRAQAAWGPAWVESDDMLPMNPEGVEGDDAEAVCGQWTNLSSIIAIYVMFVHVCPQMSTYGRPLEKSIHHT